jgi:thymidylate synthase
MENKSLNTEGRMIEVISGNTADEVWRQIASKLNDESVSQPQPSAKGPTREILHAAISIQNPRDRWIVSRIPPINPAFAIAEVVWIVTGRNDAAFLNYWNRRLPQFVGHESENHGAYGYRLRCHLGIDQIERAFNILTNNPDNRQVVLQIWDSRIDLPTANGDSTSMDTPCNVAGFLKVRRGKLEWMQMMRSNDIFLGFPYNVVQFTTLQEVVAGWLGIEVGSYNHLSDSLHLYARDIGHIKKVIPVDPQANIDSLALPKPESDLVFQELASRFKTFSEEILTEHQHEGLSNMIEAPLSFQNLLRIVGADGARRRGWYNLSEHIMHSCTNPALKQVWENWYRSRLISSEKVN